ncbi:MAG: restriction endonuclease subunit S [Cyanobacteria bacterium J06631_12]
MRLLEKHFAAAFAAPDGVEKLRRLILTFAMKGSLVPQRSEDLPASESIKKADAAKQRLIKEGVIKRGKLSPMIKVEEIPYELPESWEWVRLNEVIDVRDGTHNTPKYVDSGYPLVTSKNLYTGTLNLENVKYVAKEDYLEISKRSKVDVGDILFAMIGSIGNPVMVSTDVEFAIKNVALFKFYIEDSPCRKYLYYFLLQAQEDMREKSSGAVQSFVSLGYLRKYLFPLPPIEEQHRIVAKIDQLMARCDELEKPLAERDRKQITVHTAALNRLLTAPDTNTFTESWQFITKHFSELYSVKENVAELRKAILQLAVMGKLTKQDPDDVSVRDLLESISENKTKKMKRVKSSADISSKKEPFNIPRSWQWIKLGDVVLSAESGWSPQCLREPRVKNDWGVLKVSAVSWGAFNSKENKALPPNKDPRPECEVKTGDFLISRANTAELVARSVVVDNAPKNLMMSDKIVRFSFFDCIDKYFVNIANGTYYARNYYIDNASGTSNSMKNVSRSVMLNLPIPLAPISEQKQITHKVSQLMTLCDELEQQIEASAAAKSMLLTAILAEI